MFFRRGRRGILRVALEASEALARWKRDLSALAGYGYGQGALDAFATDLAEHAKLRSARPEAVAERKMSVATRDKLPDVRCQSLEERARCSVLPDVRCQSLEGRARCSVPEF